LNIAEWTLAQSQHGLQIFPMEVIFSQLAAALRDRLAIIADGKSRRDTQTHTARLQNISERIEALERQLPPNTDPHLRHFLQRRSYSKALEFIQAPASRT